MGLAEFIGMGETIGRRILVFTRFACGQPVITKHATYLLLTNANVGQR